MSVVEETLKERGSVYGPFDKESEMVAHIMFTLIGHKPISQINYVAFHTAQMIATKLVRAFNGDITYVDNWHDMAGYATLAEKHFKDI